MNASGSDTRDMLRRSLFSTVKNGEVKTSESVVEGGKTGEDPDTTDQVDALLDSLGKVKLNTKKNTKDGVMSSQEPRRNSEQQKEDELGNADDRRRGSNISTSNIIHPTTKTFTPPTRITVLNTNPQLLTKPKMYSLHSKKQQTSSQLMNLPHKSLPTPSKPNHQKTPLNTLTSLLKIPPLLIN